MRRCLLLVCCFGATLLPASVRAADAEPAPKLDPATVYRYDPMTGTLAPIPTAETKAGFVYLRHSARLGRHVWSLADGAGSFRYAMGPGSSQPARNFDLRADMATRRREFEARAPELARRLAVEGARPSLKLDAEGRWQLEQSTNSGRIHDLETGRRWEMQWDRPVAVIHTAGAGWSYRDGRFVPAGTAR